MSTQFTPFELFSAPLNGIQLIEASAGTGKTYTIAGLYLRLLLEGLRRVDQILVVTFTNAATEELKDRIRQRLVQVRNVFQQAADGAADADTEHDPLIAGLLARLHDPSFALRRLDNAIRGFDEAAIFTIHGFCQRVLADRAFASGMPFETELRGDIRELQLEIVEDFWRREFYYATPLLVSYLLANDYTPERLWREIRPFLEQPQLEVLPIAHPSEFESAETEFSDAYTAVRDAWLNESMEIKNRLLEARDLKANIYRPGSMQAWFRALDEYLMPDAPNPDLFKSFENFTVAKLIKSTKKNGITPGHPFFATAERLLSAHQALADRYETRLKALRIELLAFCNRELAKRKRREQLQSFDDLVGNLYHALQGPLGEDLAEQIRERYSAALIDEFQDTDPVQYDIFRRLYAKSEQAVFFVGDPKQAIYSFRGADVFAYLRAHDDAGQRATLVYNWRSDPALIAAVNALFEHAKQPFLLDDIEFHSVQAAATERKKLHIGDDDGVPLRFWFLAGEEDNKPLSKGDAGQLAAQASAAEIADLLNRSAAGQAELDGRPLSGGDIAVLVRKHREGNQVNQALLELGIPSVQRTLDNVFATVEAEELERLLRALAEPGRETWVRGALATTLLGFDAATLYALAQDEQAWETQLERFHELHRVWREQGFIRMFRQLLREFDVARRLLVYYDGERRLTNLLHLMELLQQAVVMERLGLERLVTWLADRREADSGAEKELQLRLESDANLVQIVTVHRSKGLEYPIVFCPYLWDGRLSARDKARNALRFHDPNRNRRAVLDLGSDDFEQHRDLAADEELAENLRLLYVALTRAKYRCYVVWGKIREAESSPLAWLLYQPNVIGPGRGAVEAVAERVKSMAAWALHKELAQLAQQQPQAVTLTSLPALPGSRYQPAQSAVSELRSRRFNGPVRGHWQISSFSALMARHGNEKPDYDASVWVQTDTANVVSGAVDSFNFPRGARAGTCLHRVFELLDFAATTVETSETVVRETLAQFGYVEQWVPVIVTLVEQVLSTPLNEAGLRLANVTTEQRLNELEFYYPLAGIEPEGLRRILAPLGVAWEPLREELENLDFAYTQGYMKGFIDLIFEADGRYYIADYKSNWLGASLDDYNSDALIEAMAREGYFLQYIIYSVALHRYLRLRLPDYDYQRHFGGVFYLFLRGMEPSQAGSGVFADCPDQDVIEALDRYLEDK